MIMNACVKNDSLIDENICKNCKDKNCRHAGYPTTKERLDMYTYGDFEVPESYIEVPVYSEELNEEGSYDVIAYRKEYIN